MRCRECGSENMEGADRCWRCSAGLRTEESRARGTWITWLAAGVVACLLVFLMLSAGTVTGGGGVSDGSETTSTPAATSTPAPAPAPTPAPATAGST